MIRKSQFFIFLILMNFNGICQDNVAQVDSLDKLLKKKTFNDSINANILRQLAYLTKDPQGKKQYALELIELSSTNRDVNGLYNGYYFLGHSERYLGNTNESLQAFLKCLTYAQQLNAKSLCETYTAIGDLYSLSEDYDNSLLYYNKGIRALEKGGNLTPPERKKLANAYLNAGDTYFLIDKLDSALLFFDKSGQIYEQIDYQMGLGYNLGNIGLVYAKLGENEQAESNIKQAVDILSDHNDFYAISVYYTYMADIYAEREDTTRALQYASESYNMAHQYGLKEQIRDASYKLYELHSQNDYSKALKYHLEYTAYKDSITNRETIQEMANQRTQFEVGQKQAELDLITAQQRTERIIMIGMALVAIIFVILAIIIYNFYRSKARLNEILESQKLTLEHQKHELESLNETKDKFFSIISHDLRGPISSFFGISRMIKYMAQARQTDQLVELADDIDDSVSQLSSLLDNLLNWATQQRGHIPYTPEKIEVSYLAGDLVKTLSNMAKAKNIELVSEVEPGLAAWADRNTTMTIVRNLVNNSLKFTPEGGEVILAASLNGNHAEIKISDTGVGMPQEKLDRLFDLQAKKSTYGTSGEKGLGLGLQLVKEFVELNQGDIKVESEEGKGTTFMIKLPLFKTELVSGQKEELMC